MKTGVNRWFVDTNILVFATNADSPFQSDAEQALNQCRKQGAELYISTQILREYLAVTSRVPLEKSSAPDYEAILGNLTSFRAAFNVLEDTKLVSEKLGELVARFAVKGRQVHDANIAATMLAHGLRDLLTHNGDDFARFASLITVHAL